LPCNVLVERGPTDVFSASTPPSRRATPRSCMPWRKAGCRPVCLTRLPA